MRRVNRQTGTSEPVATGLQTAVDALPVTRGRGLLYVLEYSSNFLAGTPGRLLHLDENGVTPTVLATGLPSPVSMDVDPRTGDMLVLDHQGGRLLLVPIPR